MRDCLLHPLLVQKVHEACTFGTCLLVAHFSSHVSREILLVSSESVLSTYRAMNGNPSMKSDCLTRGD